MFSCVVLVLVFAFLAKELPGTCYYHARTLPQKVYAHMGVFSPSKNAVYLFGGLTGTEWADVAIVQAIYKWDLSVAGSWFEYIGTPYASTVAEQFFTWNNNAVLVGDLVFFVGIGINTIGVTDEMFVYDLDTESFSSQTNETRARVPTASVAGCLTTNGTHIFMVDGRDFTGSVHPPFLYVYDVAGDAWQSHQLNMGVTTIGGWREQYCSFVGELLYVAGGNTDGQSFDEVFSIDVRTLDTQFIGSLPQANSGGATVFDNNASMYMLGGWKMSTAAIAFDIETDEVTTAFQTQDAFASAVVLAINNQIYRFGGMDNVDYFASDKVEICDFPAPTEPTTAGPTAVAPTTAAPTSDPTTTSTTPVITQATTMAQTTLEQVTTKSAALESSTRPPTSQPTNSSAMYSYVVTIQTHSLTSTQIILVADYNAQNLSLAPFTVTVLSQTDTYGDDGLATVELLVAVPVDVQLDSDVIESTLREAMVDEYGSDIEVDITVEGEAEEPSANQSNSWHWIFTVAVCVSSVCCCCFVAGIIKCSLSKREPDNNQQAQVEIARELQLPSSLVNQGRLDSESGDDLPKQHETNGLAPDEFEVVDDNAEPGQTRQ